MDLAVRHDDFNALLNYTRPEFDLVIFNGDEVFVSNGSFLALYSILIGISIDDARDDTIAAVRALQNDVNGLVLASYIHLSFFEADTSGLVFINNKHLTLCVITWKACLSNFVEQLDFEGLIWLPLGVINNSNLNLALFFFGMHRKQLIFFFIVLAGSSCHINSAYPEGEILRGLLFNGDSDTLVALSHFISQMLEADTLAVVFSLFFVRLSLALGALFELQKVLCLVPANLFAVHNTLDSVIGLQTIQKLVN